MLMPNCVRALSVREVLCTRQEQVNLTMSWMMRTVLMVGLRDA